MFKRISVVVMVLVMVAMLPVTAFAEVDRDAVEKRLVEYFFTGPDMNYNDDGYVIPIEDNPNASLYYSFYIKPFVEQSSDTLLENIDLTDETDNSVSKFVKFWYLDWESEQPGVIDCLMNDGKSYEYIEERDGNWIIVELGGDEQTIEIEKTDKSFIFSVDEKELGTYDRMLQYTYLNDEEEIAFAEEERKNQNGEQENILISSANEQEVPEENTYGTNQQPAVTPNVVERADESMSTETGVTASEPKVEEPKKSNTSVVVGVLAVAVIGVTGFVYFKKKKEN